MDAAIILRAAPLRVGVSSRALFSLEEEDRCRDPDCRRKLQAARPCRSHPRTRQSKRAHCAAAATQASRQTAETKHGGCRLLKPAHHRRPEKWGILLRHFGSVLSGNQQPALKERRPNDVRAAPVGPLGHKPEVAPQALPHNFQNIKVLEVCPLRQPAVMRRQPGAPFEPCHESQPRGRSTFEALRWSCPQAQG